MSDDVLALADRLWRGEVTTSELHPVGHLGGLDKSTSTMARGVFRWTAGEAEG